MGPRAARAIVFVETVESEDSAGELLPHEERRKAEPPMGVSPGSRLVQRAQVLEGYLQHARPGLTAAARRWTRLGWKTTFWICFAALLLGAQAQWLTTAGERSFHILAPWLLFLLGLNLLMSVVGLVAVLRGARARVPWIGAAILAASARWELREDGGAGVDTLRSFRRRWLKLAAPMLAAEVRRALHFGSIFMATGALASAAVVGSVRRFEATVESSFIPPQRVYEFATEVLRLPASLVGVSLPALPEGATGLIGAARPWLLAYGAAFCLVVFLPRLLLVLLESARLVREVYALGRRVAPSRPAPLVDLALVSHTNIGKTSLTRTLLSRQVGEVRDAENVTSESEGYWMIRGEGVGLRLWDTPGFDKVEPVLRYLRAGGVGRWWQRRRERTPEESLAREIVETLSDEADVVAYVVDGSLQPEDSAYVPRELDVLREAEIATLVLLNRVESESDGADERLEGTWSSYLAEHGHQVSVIALDAHQRCWVQEARLVDEVARLAAEKRPAARKLMGAWLKSQTDRLQAVAAVMAGSLCKVAEARETTTHPEEEKAAESRLAEKTQRAFAEATDALFDLHGVTGAAGQLILNLLGTRADALTKGQDPAKRAMHGVLAGVLSGMASGLAADAMAGGLTFGGGAVVGAILGGLGGTGVSEGFHWFKQLGHKEIRWTDAELREIFKQQCELYLAVAHYGRARGTFSAEEAVRRSQSWDRILEEELDQSWMPIVRHIPGNPKLASERIAQTLEALLARLWPRAAKHLDLGG